MFGWMFGWFQITPGWSTDRPTTWQKHVFKNMRHLLNNSCWLPSEILQVTQKRGLQGKTTAKQLCDFLLFFYIFYYIFIGIISSTAPENYSASIWYDMFWDSLMGEPKKTHFYDFRICWRVHGSQNQLFFSLETPGRLKKKSPEQLSNICFINL